MFGAPNGLCSSITENRHIQAVKEPWRRSNRHEPLGQMLLTNQRLAKLAAARVDFTARGMLQGPSLLQSLGHAEDEVQDDIDEDDPGNVEASAEDEVQDGIDEDVAAVDGPTCLGEVTLAKCRGRLTLPLMQLILMLFFSSVGLSSSSRTAWALHRMSKSQNVHRNLFV